MEGELTNFRKMLDGENQEIVTDRMIVQKNILKFSHTTVQLSSISQVYIGSIKMKVKIPYIAILVLLFSLYVFSQVFLLGLALFILSGGYIYFVFSNIPKDKTYLTLELNSGKNYSITFNEYDFANQVRTIIEEAFNNKTIFAKEINIKENKIKNIIGNNNIVDSNNDHSITDNSINNSGNHNSGNSSIGHQTNNDLNQTNNIDFPIDWESMQQDLVIFLKAIEFNTTSLKSVSEQALILAEKKDEQGFINLIKRNKNLFTSDIFKGVASGLLVEVTANILNLK